MADGSSSLNDTIGRLDVSPCGKYTEAETEEPSRIGGLTTSDESDSHATVEALKQPIVMLLDKSDMPKLKPLNVIDDEASCGTLGGEAATRTGPSQVKADAEVLAI